ncbi:MAG: hypothetical protein RIQ81_2576 [Pseudomonadota bacterium]|jgi:hypothetical protein
MDSNRILRSCAFVLWAGLTLWLTAHHEIWRDEVDSWLLARDASFLEMFSILPNKGQPPLWYLLLKGAVAVGLDWRAMQGINLAAVWGAGWLLLFRSGIPLLTLIPVLFSFLLSYEYPVIARNYGLGILGLFMYADAQSRPGARGWLWHALAQLLLCWSTVHFLTMALVLFCFRFLDQCSHVRQKKCDLRQFAKTEIPFFVFFLLAVVVLWPTGEGQLSGGSFWERFQPENFRDSIANSLFPFEVAALPYLLVALVLYGLLVGSLSNPRRAVLFFLAGAGALEAIFCFKYYQGAPRHSGLIFIWLCFVLWISASRVVQKNSRSFLFNRSAVAPVLLWMLFAWNIPVTTDVWRLETKQNFSDAVAAASIVNLKEMQSRDIICWPPHNCAAVLAYLPEKFVFWSPYLARRQTFSRWDREAETIHGQVIGMGDVIDASIPYFPAWGKVNGPVFLSMRRVNNPEQHGLRLLAPAPKTAWRVLDESFWIYGPLADEALATAVRQYLQGPNSGLADEPPL